MSRLKVSRNFYLDEFIHPTIYEKYGDHSIWFIDKRIITIAQAFRDVIDVPITINNWYNGGRFINSGLRRFEKKYFPKGAKMSQHKYGRAVDLKFQGLTDYEEIRDIVRNNFPYFKSMGLTTIEQGTKTWLHCDCRETRSKELFEVPFF